MVRVRSGRYREGAFARLGRLGYRHPVVMLSAWAVLVGLALATLPALSRALTEGGLYVEGSDSLRASQVEAAAFPDRPTGSAFLVFTSRTLTASDPAYRAFVAAEVAAARRTPSVAAVLPPGTMPGMVSPDGHTSYALVNLSGDTGEALRAGRGLLALVERAPAGPVQVRATGSAPLMAESLDAAAKDLRTAERVGLPIAALVLVVVFGSLVAAGLPLVVAGASLALGFGLLYALTFLTEVGGLVENATTMIGLAVAIDYSLFIVTRYREELARAEPGARREDAVARTMATAGRAVFFSGMTVFLALSGLLLVRVPILRAVALGPMIVVLLALAAALTMIPALLRAVGTSIDRLRVPGLRPWRPSAGRGFWSRWASAVMARPVAFLLAATLPLLALSVPVTALRLGESGVSMVPREFAARQGYERLAAAFPAGTLGPIDVVVEAPQGALTPGVATGLNAFVRRVSEDPRVARVDSYLEVLPYERLMAILRDPVGSKGLLLNDRAWAAFANFVDVDRGGAVTLITVRPKVAPDRPAAAQLALAIRERYAPAAFGDLRVHVGGAPAETADARDSLLGSIPLAYGYILVLSFVLLLVIFRSIAIPLVAVFANLLSVGAAFGVLVLVFQHGVAAGLLGTEAMPFLNLLTPLMIFAVLFGLSMDYEVFLLSRIREAHADTGDTRAAVETGLQTTGRTITAAALIMVVVFAAFVPGRLVPVKQIGLGLAVAVLLDATVIRIALVPAAMRLLGRWNWWLPRWLARILPDVSVEGERRPEARPEDERPPGGTRAA